MGGVKCLACGEVNTPGDEACRACSSSLDLKLCAVCEAMNHSQAQKCYKCGTALVARAASMATAPSLPEMLVAEAPETLQLPDRAAPRAFRPAPRARARRSSLRGLVIGIGLAAIGGAAVFLYPAMKPASAGSSMASPQPEAQAVAGSITRPPIQERLKAPPVKAESAPVTPAKAQSTTAVPGRVTHTRATATPVAAAAASPAVVPVPQAGAAPSTPKAAATAECPEGVAALGLCSTNK